MKKTVVCLTAACLCICLCFGGSAAFAAQENVSEQTESAAPSEEAEIREIGTPQELLGMADYPFGNYKLTADIDMTGVSWKPLAFCGSFDGDGFSILNLEITATGKGVEETFDGNMKVYDTSFAGFFDTLKGAYVKGLKLINLRADVETPLPCFVGGIAGYMEGSTLEDCSVQGILQLRAHDRMFGVGGIIGYGCGSIQNTEADVTLVCIDTDAGTKDEQFMGGVCAAGYPDINGCSVKISGFDSDHGYVHDGGLVGMYMFYPRGTKYYGSITDNQVTGKITFFEDNNNRRAYCNGFIGEIMNWDFENGRNKDEFVRDERFVYDVDLLPHSCENAMAGEGKVTWEETVTPPGCETFGFTEKKCADCGYAETDAYTLKSHDLAWQTVREATTEESGLERGECKNCGYAQERELAKLEPTPTPEPEPTPVPYEEERELTENPVQEEAKGPEKSHLLLLSAAFALLAGAVVWGIAGGRKKGRR